MKNDALVYWLLRRSMATVGLLDVLVKDRPDQRKRADEIIAEIEKADRIIPVLIGFASESAQ